MRKFSLTKKIKSIVSVMLVLVLMFPAFVMGQNQGLSDFLTKSRKNEKEQTVKERKLPPRIMQTKRPVKMQQSIPSATNLKRTLSHKDSSKSALAVTESGAALYGNLIYNASWLDMSNTGFHYINHSNGTYIPIATSEYFSGAGTVVDGIAYISYAGLYENVLYTLIYDIYNNEFDNVIEHDPEDYTSYAVNMAYDHINDIIYALVFDEYGINYRLSKFNPNNFSYVKIADIIIDYDILAMTFDDKGILYIMCSDGYVREMNPSTGAVVRDICDTDFLPAYMQSACWSPKDNKILWAASNDNESYILAIDVTEGTTETVCTFNQYEEWTCLYTTDPMAAEDAPETPVITYDFDSEGALTGTITVQVPSLTVAGDELSSDGLSLVVQLNSNEIYNAQVTSGQEVTLSDVQFVEGENTIRAYAVNDAGNSVTATNKLYAGNDTPKAVTNIVVAVNDEGLATITWNAPYEGEHDGYIDTDALTYTVERNGETIATELTGTLFQEQLPDEIATYQWTIYAVFDNKVSKPATSEKTKFGSYINLPYEQAFDNANCLDLFTIVNDNSDNYTWRYDTYRNALLYSYNKSLPADDYAFTPSLRLTANKMILVEITPYCYMSNYPEKIEVTLGTSTHPLYQTVIIPATVVDWSTPQVMRAYFSVEESGNYNIGIHAVSDADSFYLMVKDIKVTEGSSVGAPRSVSDVTVTPGDNGALTAAISFKAPTESFNGNALTEDVTVTLYRNDKVVGETVLAPGANGNFVDNSVTNGINNFALVASNSAGEGDIYEISCFCGVDIPSYVNNVQFTTEEDNLSTVISWEAPEGENGGYINLDEIVYTIYALSEDGENIEVIKETSELSYKIIVDSDILQVHTFYVSAKNNAGESDLVGGSVVLGTPYALPFIEQVTGTSLVNSPWLLYNENYDSYMTWELGSMVEHYTLPEPVIAPDGGMLVCHDPWQYSNGSCGLLSPKISLKGAKAPTLYFSTYHYTTAANVNELSVKITTDDAVYETIFNKKINDVTENGWVEYQISLDEFKDAAWISVMFDAYIDAKEFAFLDYAIVENESENDVLVSSVVAPSNAKIGEEIEIVANILNKGNNDASYKVEFYVNNELLTSATGTELASDDAVEHTANYTPKTEDLGELIVKAVVTMTEATDEIINNNEATAKVTVVQPYLRVITDLDGKSGDETNTVTLTWTAPVLSGEASLDDMEDYESFIINNIGNYTIVDADNMETYGIEGLNIPVPNGPKAWQVWAPQELGNTIDSWQAYSGEKCLVAFSTIYGSADDWLISPEVVGGTEFSFRAAIPTNQYGAETFEILYSKSDTNTSSFQLLESESKGTTAWEEFVYTLPNDAKYFAIRYTSTDIFALLIDDISYVDISGSSDLTISGYNVYGDDGKLNNEIITETTFVAPVVIADGDSHYNVTVVYNEGESLYSNTFVYKAEDGIEDMNSIGVNVYGQDDFIRIENVAGRVVRVFSIDGKTICNVKSTDDNILIPAKVGTYIVNIDNIASCKVVVR